MLCGRINCIRAAPCATTQELTTRDALWLLDRSSRSSRSRRRAGESSWTDSRTLTTTHRVNTLARPAQRPRTRVLRRMYSTPKDGMQDARLVKRDRVSVLPSSSCLSSLLPLVVLFMKGSSLVPVNTAGNSVERPKHVRFTRVALQFTTRRVSLDLRPALTHTLKALGARWTLKACSMKSKV